jgi:hypothetical protein
MVAQLKRRKIIIIIIIIYLYKSNINFVEHNLYKIVTLTLSKIITHFNIEPGWNPLNFELGGVDGVGYPNFNFNFLNIK